PRGRLHKLPRIGVQRLEIAALAFGEENVESQSALAAAGDAGDDRELVEAQAYIDIFEIVLTRAVDFDGRRHDGSRRRRAGIVSCRCIAHPETPPATAAPLH